MMLFSDLHFLHARHIPECNARIHKQFDGYHTLQFAEQGGVEVYYGDTRYDLSIPSVWTAFPGETIRFHARPEHFSWNHRYAAFTGTRVAQWIADGLWFDTPQNLVPTPDFVARFDALVEMVNTSKGRFASARAGNLLEGILLELAENRVVSETKSHTTPDWFASLVAQMTEPNFDVARYACAENVSLTTLRRGFKAATGTPIHEYIIKHRIAAARALLADTDTPIKAIALDLGYKDVYFFTRQFRQVVGVPPAAFRQSRQ